MLSDQCRDRLRFRLNDDSGVLRFMDFEILNPSKCQNVEENLRRYLIGRALADVDLDYLRELTCTGSGECMQLVIREVEKHQRLFARDYRDHSVAC